MKNYDTTTKPALYKYQLTHWMKHKEYLDPFVEPFIRHNDHDYGCVVEGKDGFAIFTRGERMQDNRHIVTGNIHRVKGGRI